MHTVQWSWVQPSCEKIITTIIILKGITSAFDAEGIYWCVVDVCPMGKNWNVNPSSHSLPALPSGHTDWTIRMKYIRCGCSFSSLNGPSASSSFTRCQSPGMQNDIRDVSETLSSHHPFVSVFSDQMTLIIGWSSDSQGCCNQIKDQKNAVTQMPVGFA